MEGSLTDPSSSSAELAAATHRTPGPAAVIKPCANCRRRKVRCDKNDPCGNCVRSGNRCIYEGISRNEETGVFHDTLSAAELRERLGRLEILIERAASLNLREPTLPQGEGPATEPSPTGLLTAPRSDTDEPSQNIGREVFGIGSSIHVDASAWPEVFERIEDVRFWMARSSLEASSPAIFNPSAFVSGLGPDAHSRDVDFYPSMQQSDLLCKIFLRIVEPFVKILHRPTFVKELELYRRQSFPFQADFEALLLVIHALTIAVLPPDVVHQTFNGRKDDMLPRFQLEAEKAMARANCLTSRHTLSLQAYLYYVTLLYERGQYDEASSLTGLALRLSQRVGVQYDPSHFNYSPWTAEMRRRLWNYTVRLDFRALSLCASESLIPRTTSWDTQPPKNLDDAEWEAFDFSGRSSDKPSREGFRETTFSIARRQFAYLYRQITQTRISFEASQALIHQQRARMHHSYLRHFKTEHPLHQLVAALIQQHFTLLDIISRQAHLKQHAESSRPESPTNVHPTVAVEPGSFRHNLFLASLAHLEETSRMEAQYSRYKWEWTIRDPVPWHAIARILTDLCHWFEGPEVERAWKQINLVWERYSTNNAGLVGSPIWRPLESMREQAKFRLQEQHESETPSTTPTSRASAMGMATPAHLAPSSLQQITPDIFAGSPFYPMSDFGLVGQPAVLGFYPPPPRPGSASERTSILGTPYGVGMAGEQLQWEEGDEEGTERRFPL